MKAGFTLIECLIYLSCSAIFSLALCILVNDVVRKLSTVTRKTDIYISTVGVLDYMCNDLMYMPAQKFASGEYGYALENSKLIRTVGRVRSVVGQNIDELVFNVHYKNSVVAGIECTVRCGAVAVKRFVACRNGSIICNS